MKLSRKFYSPPPLGEYSFGIYLWPYTDRYLITNKKVITLFCNLLLLFYLTVYLLVFVALTYLNLYNISLYDYSIILLRHPLLLDTWIFYSFFIVTICVLVNIFLLTFVCLFKFSQSINSQKWDFWIQEYAHCKFCRCYQIALFWLYNFALPSKD